MSGEFRLLAGEASLSDYRAANSQWPEGTVHHHFCRRCGIRAFSKGYLDMAPFNGWFHAVNVATLDDASDTELAGGRVQYEDGRGDAWDTAPAAFSHL